MLKIIPNKKNIGAEIIVNLKDITNKDILKIHWYLHLNHLYDYKLYKLNKILQTIQKRFFL